jgi:enamine deaminase RidA (YjgF/YER057c/UK114 family)
MAGRIEKILQEKGIELPEPGEPLGTYLPAVIASNFLFVSGQGPKHHGKVMFKGKVGASLFVPEAQMAARHCALNVVAVAKAALDGDLDRILRLVKLGGFVNSTDDFKEHPQVVNGASDLMAEIFGDEGRHARFAIGCNSLPGDISVEVDAIFEIT